MGVQRKARYSGSRRLSGMQTAQRPAKGVQNSGCIQGLHLACRRKCLAWEPLAHRCCVQTTEKASPGRGCQVTEGSCSDPRLGHSPLDVLPRSLTANTSSPLLPAISLRHTRPRNLNILLTFKEKALNKPCCL